MPAGVERIARTFLRHPVTIKIGDEDSGKNKRIEQRVQFVSEGQKKTCLMDDLRKLKSTDKCIVFINSKKQGDTLEKMLGSSGFDVGVLHGGRSQEQREATLDSFRSAKIKILVATDVAGRGLDISDVTYVINFDMSGKIENYWYVFNPYQRMPRSIVTTPLLSHRIGRTGRAGKTGIAITYLTGIA